MSKRTAYVSIDRRRLFPHEASAVLPLQARLFNRMCDGRLSSSDLEQAVAIGVFSRQDDPDAVNALVAQGW